MIVDELGRRFYENPIVPVVLEVNFHVPFHNFPRVIGKYGKSHRKILAIKPCCFFRHLKSSHQVIQHRQIGLKSDSHSSDIILLVDEFSLVEDSVKRRSEYLIATISVDGDKVVVDEGGGR